MNERQRERAIEKLRDQARREIVDSKNVFAVPLYFLRHWLSQTNHALAWTVIALRQGCYRNDKRDWCELDQVTLASESGVTDRWLRKQLKTPAAGWFIRDIKESYGAPFRGGRPSRKVDCYHLRLPEVLTPQHQAGLELLLQRHLPGDEPDVLEAALGALRELVDVGDGLVAEVVEAAGACRAAPAPKSVPELVRCVADLSPVDFAGDERLEEFDDLCRQVLEKIVSPNEIFLGRQYFRRNWTSILRPTKAWLVVLLRSRCYWNEETEEERRICSWDKGELATLLGVSTRHLPRLLHDGDLRQFFTVVEETHHHLTFDVLVRTEPLLPEDEPRLERRVDELLRDNGLGEQLPLAIKPDISSGMKGAEPDISSGMKPDISANMNAEPDISSGMEPDISSGMKGAEPDISSGMGPEPDISSDKPDISSGYTNTPSTTKRPNTEDEQIQQQQQIPAAAVAELSDQLTPESTTKPPDRPSPGRPGGEQPLPDRPADARQEEPSEPGRPSPGRPGGEQPPPDKPADAQPGEDSGGAEPWLAKLRAMRKRRDRANTLYRMSQALLGVEFEYRDMGRLDKQYGPIPVAEAILRCAESGGHADLERIVQILEGRDADTPEPGDGLDPQQRQAVGAVVGLGYDIAEADARSLVQQHGADIVLAQVERLPARLRAYEQRGEPVANPAGLLIRSVEGNWPPPAERRKRKRGGGRARRDEDAVADNRGGAAKWQFNAE